MLFSRFGVIDRHRVRTLSWPLAFYAVVSTAYRIVVLGTVVLVIYRVCSSHGVTLLAHLLSLSILAGVLSQPVYQLILSLRRPRRSARMNRSKTFGAFAVATALLAGIFWMPLPCRVSAPLAIRPADARKVFVSVPGTLSRVVLPGTNVKKGWILSHKLEDIGVEREIESIRSKIALQELHVTNLNALRNEQRTLASQLPAAEEMLQDLRQTIHAIAARP